jgi:hypothetical protein
VTARDLWVADRDIGVLATDEHVSFHVEAGSFEWATLDYERCDLVSLPTLTYSGSLGDSPPPRIRSGKESS